MSDPDAPRRKPEPRRSAAERHFAPFLEDSALWPLLVVIALVAATCLVALLVSSLERNYFALAAALGLFFMSCDWTVRDLRTRHLGPISRFLIGLWLLAATATALLTLP